MIPFNIKFWNPDEDESGPPELEQDKELPVKLRQELEGILAWAVRGCLNWQKQGIGKSPEITTATAEYKSSEDVVGRFLGDCCNVDPDATVVFGALYTVCQSWCADSGEYLPSRTFMGK